MWEVFTYGHVPYPDIQVVQQLLWSLSSGSRLQCPLGCPSQLYEMMLKCWAINPMERISAAQLEQELGCIVLAMETNQPWQLSMKSQEHGRSIHTAEDDNHESEFAVALSRPTRLAQPNPYSTSTEMHATQNPIFGMEESFGGLDSSKKLGLPLTAERGKGFRVFHHKVVIFCKIVLIEDKLSVDSS